MVMEKIRVMQIIACVIMVFSVVYGIRSLRADTSKTIFYIRAFVMHLTLAAAAKILMFIDPTPGITALNLTPMELVNWYCILIGLFSGIIAFFRILLQPMTATGNPKKTRPKRTDFYE